MSDTENNRVRVFTPQISDPDDPLVEKVSWEPLLPGGTGFTKEKLVRSGGKMVIKKTLGYRVYTIMVILIGLCLTVGGPFVYHWRNDFNESKFDLMGIGICILGIGCIVYGIRQTFFGCHSMVFDGTTGTYYQGKNKRGLQDAGGGNEWGQLSSIHALQIIKEDIQCGGGQQRSSFTSYELNLVLDNATRVNVMDHNNLRAIIEAALQLAEFLDVSVWKKEESSYE